MYLELLPSWVSRIRLAAAIVMAVACAVLAIGVGSASAATTELTDVEINEVESNGDEVHGDWIELYNTGAEVGEEVDLSSVILSDDDNGHRFVIPKGTFLGVEEWIAFQVDDEEVAGNFGLGKEDSARLFPAGTENLGSVSPEDIYTWTAHAATTYGADPDGSEEFKTTAVGTFGAKNDFGLPAIGNIEGIKLNEVESNGDVENGDWVELYNTTGSEIDISGAIITDDNPAHQFVVPSSTKLGAGKYDFFRVNDPEVAGNFGLGTADEAKLYAPGDVTLSKVVDQFSWSSHAAVTYGRKVAGAGEWKPTSVSTPGAVNQFSEVEAPDLSKVVINEAESHGDDTNGDWIELKNTGGESVDLDSAILSDNDNGHVFRIPTETPELGPGEYAFFRVDDPALGDGQFGLGDTDEARLFEADAVDLADEEKLVDSQDWSTHAVRTWGREGESEWEETSISTPGAANDFVSAVTADLSDVVLNEVVTTGDTVHGDWIELLNTSGSTLDLGGMIIADCDGHEYTIPAETMRAAGKTYVLNTAETAEFGLGKEDCARLYRDGEASIPVDHHEWDEHPVANPEVNPFASFARQSGGFGDWETDTSPSYNEGN